MLTVGIEERWRYNGVLASRATSGCAMPRPLHARPRAESRELRSGGHHRLHVSDRLLEPIQRGLTMVRSLGSRVWRDHPVCGMRRPSGRRSRGGSATQRVRPWIAAYFPSTYTSRSTSRPDRPIAMGRSQRTQNCHQVPRAGLVHGHSTRGAIGTERGAARRKGQARQPETKAARAPFQRRRTGEEAQTQSGCS